MSTNLNTSSLKSFALIFLFWLLSFPALAQKISGSVQDTDGRPLPYANALLVFAKDSALVKGTLTNDNGQYELTQVRGGDYRLLVSMVGYLRVYSTPFTVLEANQVVTLPTIVALPDARQLKEVSIVTTRPFVEEQIDRTVVNVANSIIASGSTALEVLEKAPGVTVDRQNDGISLRGKDGVIVQIDGKQTYLAMSDVVALLRSMPSDNIDKIELITNPSAKYDAAGNSGIINIRMKKNQNYGTNGSVSLAGGSGRFDRERGSMQVNHRTRRLNFFSNYGANRGGNYWTLITDQDMLRGGERTVIYQDTHLKFRDWGQNAKAGLDFFVGKNTTLGVIWTGFWNRHEEEGPANSYFRRLPGGPMYLEAKTSKTLLSEVTNQVGNLNLQHSFGEKWGQLTADFDLGHFQRDFSNSLVTETTRADEPFPTLDGLLNLMPTTIDIRTLKADYNRPLSESWKIEAGLKQSFVRTDNDLTLSSGLVGEMQVDPLLSNHFKYTERVNAAYASLSGKLGAKTEMMIGLRAEQTHSVGHSLTLRQRVERDYLDLFPSLFFSRPLSPNQSLALSYSRRIDRPNYESLNPSRSYADPYLYSQGNAFLQPQYTQAFELKHGYKGTLYTSLGASFTDDLIFYVIRPVDNTTTERTPLNIGQSQVYNLTVSFPVTVAKGWNLQSTLLGFYSHFQYDYEGTDWRVQQMSARLNGTNSILLGKGWSAELTGWLNSPRVNALIRVPWLGSLDAGLQKTVTAKLKAKLSVQDVFHTNGFIGEIQTPEFTRSFRLAFDTRVAMLNLTYSFGNQQVKGMRQRKTGSEEEMQRTN
jgi:hypothetical protein